MDRTTLTERLRRAEAEIAAGRAEEALNYCQELQSAYPRAIRVQRVLGEIYLALRRPREALATLDRALAGDPEDVRATCARALVHQMHGDNVAALAWYRRACDLRPDDQALRATYRNLALRLGEPAYRPSRAGLARLYLRGDLFSHAIREWEQLVNESPDMLDAQVGLAETLWLGGHPQAADERCRRILANAPACVKAMLIQMAIALAEGDMDAARAHLDRTLQLDPDMAIAQALFADALAAGDPVLTALLRPGIGAAAAESADETLKLSRSTAGFGPSGPLAGQRNVSRPLVTSAPVTSGPANGMPPPLGQPLPPPPRPDVPVPSQPTEVTRAIKETAFMIWGREEDSQPRLAAQRPSAPTRGQTAGPRALEELGGAADDEEARRALNWYNWLQEQGAVALGAATTAQPPAQPIPPVSSLQPVQPVQPVAPEPSATTLPDPAFGVAGQSAPAPGPKFTMPLPPSTSTAPSGPGTPGTPEASATSSMRQTMPLFPGSDAGSGTGPLASPHAPGMPPQNQDDEDDEPATIPLPSADVLRSMFADLGGATSPQPVVDALTPSAPAAPNAGLDASGEDNIVESAPPATDEPYESHEPFEAYTPSDAYQPNQPSEAQDEPAAGDEPFAPPPSTQEQTPQTLEDLERQFSASGFSRIEPHRGMLAEIERDQALAQQAGEGSIMPDYADEASEWGQSAETPPAPEPGPETSSPAPSVSVPSGPDARDYPARLAHARQRRDEGQFDDALNEYKAIIKNAPDLLPEVLSDLRASLDELPDHPNLHSVLGDALVSQGQYEQAIEAFNKASELAQARNTDNE